jgi:TRAP-type C4-dicarboxylate transport system substrate-binding protein
MFTRKGVCVVFSLALALWIGLSFVVFSHASEKKPEAIRWKMSSFVGPTHFMAPLLTDYCAELSKASGGRVTVELFLSSVLGTTAEHYDLVKEGTAQMATVCTAFQPDRFQLSLFSALPFATDDCETGQKVNLELIKKNLINEEWKEVKLALSLTNSPLQIQSTKRLSKAEDFKGLRVAPGGGMFGMVWEAIGAKGINIPMPEAYLALERGTLDATCVNWSGGASFKFHEVTKYAYDISILGGAMCFIFINKAAWDKLPPDIQEAWEKVSEKWAWPFTMIYSQNDEKGRQAWRNLGKEVVQFPAAERAKLAEQLLPVWQAWIEKQEARGKPAKEMYKTYVEVMKREGKPVFAKVPGLYKE